MKIATLLAVLILAMSVSPSRADDKLLTGDTRLACEAILCLSSGERPSECSPSLDRYFGILCFNEDGIDWDCTLNERRAFLNMCPVVEGNSQMQRLVSDISNVRNANSCKASVLNKRTLTKVVGRQCISYDFEDDLYLSQGREQRCLEWRPVTRTYVNPDLPGYCRRYQDNELTYDTVTARYVGDPLNGGHWVD